LLRKTQNAIPNQGWHFSLVVHNEGQKGTGLPPDTPHLVPTKTSDTDIQFVRCSLNAASDSVPDRDHWTSALSNLSFWVTSFPRRRKSSAAIWIPACAGMTVNPNFKSVNPNFGL
jgi:hypothetical protein